MVSTLKLEDMLEGETNLCAWKARVLLLLEENDLKEYVESVVADPIDPQELTTHKKKDVKVKWVLLESVKHHLIPHIVDKTIANNMYDSLVGLYQNKNTGRMLHLKHQLQIIRMTSEDTMVNYLMKITKIRYHLATIGEIVQNDELGNVALRVLLKSWEPFVQVICARDILPTFDRIWNDCIKEETRLVYKENMDGIVKSSSDENHALIAHTRRGRRGSLDKRGLLGKRDSLDKRGLLGRRDSLSR